MATMNFNDLLQKYDQIIADADNLAINDESPMTANDEITTWAKYALIFILIAYVIGFFLLSYVF